MDSTDSNQFYYPNFFDMQYVWLSNWFGTSLMHHEDGSGDAGNPLMPEEANMAFCEESSSALFSTTTTSTSMTNYGLLQMSSAQSTLEQTNSSSGADLDLVAQRRCAVSPWAGQQINYLPRGPISVKIRDEDFNLDPETVFVLGLQHNVTKNDIIKFFCRMGPIKLEPLTSRPKIFVYKNKFTGNCNGEATITFQHVYTAQQAIARLNGAKFMGAKINVLQAYLSTKLNCGLHYSYIREPGPEQQRRRRKQIWKPSEYNWDCSLCNNSNFAWRLNCNRCKVAKIESDTQPAKDKKRRWRPLATDWQCEYCFNLNFCYRGTCNRCGAAKNVNDAGSSETVQSPESQPE